MFEDINFEDLFGGGAYIPESVPGMDLSSMFAGLDPSMLASLGIYLDDNGNLMPDPNANYVTGDDSGFPNPTGAPGTTGGGGLNLGQIPRIPIPGGAGAPGSGFTGGPLGAGSTSTLGQIMQMLTGGNGLSGLIPLLASVYGGISARNATGEAADRLQGAVGEANTSTQNILGAAGAGYKPYQDAGAAALARMTSQAPSNLAGGFSPLSRAPVGQPSNLAELFKPLGSGRSLRQIGGR